MPPSRSLPGLCLALALIACDGDGPAPTGWVEVTTVSTGEGLDTDGYLVSVEGAGTLPIGINATATLAEVPAGDLEIGLTRVRGNCTVGGPHPRVIRVAAAETFRVRFDVACAATPLLDRIVFYSQREDNYDLYSMRTDGSDPVRITSTPPEEREVYPAVSPEGRRILFTNRIGPEDDFYTEYLYVMNADGSERKRLPPADGGIIGPAVWSPDGSRIAFGGHIDDQGYEIWVVNADGTGLVDLTRTPEADEVTPSWSPDGGTILFSSTEGIEIMNADGSGRRLVGGGAFSHSPMLSPDGRRIAFVSAGETRSRLHVMNADGSGAAPLLPDDGGNDYAASWSPTGDRLALIRVLDPAIEVYLVNGDGTGAVNLTDNESFEFLGAQAWGP